MRARVLAILGMCLVVVLGAFTLAAQSAEEAAARKPLEQYIRGHQTGDAAVMRAAFHPSARLQWMRDGQYSSRPLEDWLSGFQGKPAADEAQRKRRIVSVDVFGQSGIGKIELDYPNALIVDYMSLLRVDGEWKIVNKIFHTQPKAAK